MTNDAHTSDEHVAGAAHEPDDGWRPVGIDVSTPSIARVYDAVLGGKDNYPVDRAIAEASLAIVPEIGDVGRYNRAILGRGVRFMAEQGIRQFLDLGSGLPTVQNTHQVAQEHSPDARVVRLELRAEVFIRDTKQFRPLTPRELDAVAFRGGSIWLRSGDADAVSHDAPNGSFFTVRERAAFALTDTMTRLVDTHVPDSDWREAAAHLTPPELGAVLALVVVINAWNAVGVTTRAWTPTL